MQKKTSNTVNPMKLLENIREKYKTGDSLKRNSEKGEKEKNKAFENVGKYVTMIDKFRNVRDN